LAPTPGLISLRHPADKRSIGGFVTADMIVVADQALKWLGLFGW
jgi:hypothetical protein